MEIVVKPQDKLTPASLAPGVVFTSVTGVQYLVVEIENNVGSPKREDGVFVMNLRTGRIGCWSSVRGDDRAPRAGVKSIDGTAKRLTVEVE